MAKVPVLATIIFGVFAQLSAQDSTTLSLSSEIDNILQTNSSFGVHSRKRRYLVFPEGSTFTIAFCMSLKALTGADNIFTEGVNWALSYDLPNETIHDKHKKVHLPMRRHKRDLYQRVEVLMNSAGFDGRACLLRTICETAQLIPARQGVVQEIIRLLFTYPLASAAAALRSEKHWDYDTAHNKGLSDQNCYENFPCPISLLTLLLNFGMKSPENPMQDLEKNSYLNV